MPPCSVIALLQVKTRQIWGDKVYTGDSDIVAVLMHQGYYAHYLAHPPSQVGPKHLPGQYPSMFNQHSPGVCSGGECST